MHPTASGRAIHAGGVRPPNGYIAPVRLVGKLLIKLLMGLVHLVAIVIAAVTGYGSTSWVNKKVREEAERDCGPV
jgi:hypothetical protein